MRKVCFYISICAKDPIIYPYIHIYKPYTLLVIIDNNRKITNSLPTRSENYKNTLPKGRNPRFVPNSHPLTLAATTCGFN